ncbi:AAA family ATPase [Vibrio vulnificus]|uniref:General secretion pathway protein GspA n=1 Tax=Vibrio vulnificus TaxID=672 RepID=A0AAN1PQC0_VIBVL|nr:AAA family ATPase [Vibrio vulnificus]AXX60902.1 General secretion pathway protein GspA [Vibrio vulnificus]HDY7509380.1 general secretion pathway protein GspB [Vibrio vulnificus]
MYKDFFGFSELPFSIVPNSRYLYLSQRHREAITHLQAGLGDGGGFAMLTGEVGTGKTTVAKSMLANLDGQTCAALLLNPTFSSVELLEAICDEFGLSYAANASLKQLNQRIYQFLLENHQQNIQTLLVIDEAQHLAADVLEQLRLLTNLETETRKLLKVLLVGQPELQQLLQTTQLRQLAQRITGRYHLLPLNLQETADYIAFRIHTAGGNRTLFDHASAKVIAQYSHGIPRLINLICDKALQLSYHQGDKKITKATVERACHNVMAFQAEIYQQTSNRSSFSWGKVSVVAASVAGVLAIASYWPLIPTDNVAPAEPPVERDKPATELPIPPSVPDILVNDEEWLGEPAIARMTTRAQGLEALYKLWGYRATRIDTLCEQPSTSIFQCQVRQLNWQELQQTPHPLLLTLQHEGQRAYVVLLEVNSERVVLLTGEQRLTFTVPQLMSLWRGEVTDLWPMPLRETLRLGMHGEAIEVLDQLLAKALNDEPLMTTQFNAELMQRVEWFQRWQAMTEDGIAGQRTLARLQHMVSLSEPWRELSQAEKQGEEQVMRYPEFPSLAPLLRTYPLAETGDVINVADQTSPTLVASPSIPSEEKKTEDERLFENLDLSGLSPELAQKVENALLVETQTDHSPQTESTVSRLDLSAEKWHGRLPPLNLQTHMYSSDPKRRWLKINGAEFHQGEWIDHQIQLVEISAQSVIVEFQGEQIEIPALYEWKG